MEIKERVYTLKNYKENPFLYLQRDSLTMICPFTGTEQSECGEWCPAFQINTHSSAIDSFYPKLGCKQNITIVLNCFPQPVTFDIQEAPDDHV